LAKIYFDKQHDQAIEDYLKSESQADRDKIFCETIMPVFEELIHKIVYTFKYNSLPNIKLLEKECIVHLVTILNKFDTSRNTSGFSYFTVVAKNFFNASYKKHNSVCQKTVSYENSMQELEYLLVEHNEYDDAREEKEFLYFLRKEMDTWDRGRKKNYLNDVDYKVLQAIKILFDNADNIEIFNKKGIFVYLRNITNIDQKQISRSLKKFTARYNTFKKEWNEGIVDEKRYI